MKTKIDRPVLWASVVCALALAGCDAVKDVKSGPYTPLPDEREVLEGVINGLGGGRGITLSYNDNPDDAASFLGAQPSVPTDGPEPIAFAFGSLPVGTAYNVRVTGQPFGKSCVPVSGATGTIVRGQATNVVIECTSTTTRYDLTVRIPATPAVFSELKEARVILTTGEQMYAKPASEAVFVPAAGATPAHYAVTFPAALFNAAGQPAPFTWSVGASFTDPDGKEGRCQILNSTNPTNPGNTPANIPVDPANPTGPQKPNPIGLANGPQQPTGHVAIPIVGLSLAQTTSACQFTISGSVAYSARAGETAEAGAIPGGLLLEVRDTQARVKASYEVDQYGNFTFLDGSGNPAQFSSTIDSVYDVAVKRHPTGRVCVVGDAGAVSLYRTGTFNPVNITHEAQPGAAANTRAWGTRLNVFCRTLPTAAQTLAGTYRPTKWVWTAAPSPTVPVPVPVTVTYDNYDITKHNAGSSDMLTFFEDGTFLFGTHARLFEALPEAGVAAANYSAQVEHGFYDYTDPDGDPSTADGTVRFTLITDTNPTARFPTAFGTVPAPTGSDSGRNGASGLSSMPGPVLTGTPVAGAGIGIWNAVLNKVGKSTFTFGQGVNANQTLSRITGTFGTSPSLDWELTEPQSVNNEFTGSWISQDHRRFWVWDYLTNYGMHVGVLGGAPSLNDACYTMPDVRVSYGIYTRRGSNTGCYPFDRPAAGAFFTIGFVQSIDFHLTNVTAQTNVFVGVAGLNTPAVGTTAAANVAGSRLVPQFGSAAAAVLPGFIGRIPGGQTASDGRSPSPTLFLIAPASEFGSKVASTFFADTGQPASLYFNNLDAAGSFADWCPTEILGIRSTLNGSPINYPVYLCRNRAP